MKPRQPPIFRNGANSYDALRSKDEGSCENVMSTCLTDGCSFFASLKLFGQKKGRCIDGKNTFFL